MAEYALAMSIGAIVVSLIGLCLGAVALAFFLCKSVSKAELAASPLAQNQQRLEHLETQMREFVRLIERSLATRLRSTDPRIAALLAKLDAGTITPAETRELYQLIRDREDTLTVDDPGGTPVAMPRLLTTWALEFRMYVGEGATVTHTQTVTQTPPPSAS